MNGFEKFYLVDGTLCRKIPYKNGVREGIAKSYVDGKIWCETPYKNGKENGIGKHYIQGQLHEEIHYKDGKIIKVDMKQRVSPQVRAEQERTKGRSR